MWVCSPQFGVTDPQFANELAERWPDWTIHLHNGGVPRHLDLTGRDATPLLRPVADHIKSLAQIVQCGDSDPGHLADLLRRSLPNGIREIRVNPNVYQRHNFDLPQSDRMDAFLSILSRWQSLHAEAL